MGRAAGNYFAQDTTVNWQVSGGRKVTGLFLGGRL